MNSVYPATLLNGQLHWGAHGAPQVPDGVSVPVEVVIHQPKPKPSDDPRTLGEILAELARLGTFSEIEDPVEWQREIRKDRPLPGREE